MLNFSIQFLIPRKIDDWKCMLNCRLDRQKLKIDDHDWITIADGKIDGFATTNETAPSKYPLWSK